MLLLVLVLVQALVLLPRQADAVLARLSTAQACTAAFADIFGRLDHSVPPVAPLAAVLSRLVLS